jgi:hypothetical protein
MEHCYRPPKVEEDKTFDNYFYCEAEIYLSMAFVFMVFVFDCYEKGGDSLFTTLVEWWSVFLRCIFYRVVVSSLKF